MIRQGGETIEDTVRHALQAQLRGRTVVDVDDPHDLATAAVDQDLALGFESRTNGLVKLNLSESFTFRAVDPLGCVALPLD